jgi:hypothetical protein
VRDGCRLRAELIEIDREHSLMSLKVPELSAGSRFCRGGNRFSCVRHATSFAAFSLQEMRNEKRTPCSASRKSVSIVHASQQRLIMQRAVNANVRKVL